MSAHNYDLSRAQPAIPDVGKEKGNDSGNSLLSISASLTSHAPVLAVEHVSDVELRRRLQQHALHVDGVGRDVLYLSLQEDVVRLQRHNATTATS